MSMWMKETMQRHYIEAFTKVKDSEKPVVVHINTLRRVKVISRQRRTRKTGITADHLTLIQENPPLGISVRIIPA